MAYLWVKYLAEVSGLECEKDADPLLDGKDQKENAQKLISCTYFGTMKMSEGGEPHGR